MAKWRLLTDWLTECLYYDIWQTADEITIHVNKTNDIVCTIKTTLCNSHTAYVLLSQYEFLYSSLVIKLQSLLAQRYVIYFAADLSSASETFLFRASFPDIIVDRR